MKHLIIFLLGILFGAVAFIYPATRPFFVGVGAMSTAHLIVDVLSYARMPRKQNL